MSDFGGKNILITGATGLIGSHLVDTFMEMGDVHVIALGRSKKKLEAGFAEYLGNANFCYVASDVCDPFELPIRPIDFIFHAAGPMEGKIIKNYPLQVLRPNISGLTRCLEILRKQKEEGTANGRLVVFSSVTVYANNTSHDRVVTEEDTDITGKLDAGNACYAQAKRISEVIANAYSLQYDLDVVIARFSTVYGNTRFIPDTAFFEFMEKATRGEDITVNSPEAPRRDNIYIDDAIAGVLTIAGNGVAGEAYNISSNGDGGNYKAVDEIAVAFADASNNNAQRERHNPINVSYRENISDPIRKPGLRLNNSKLKGLGWECRIEFAEGISRSLMNYVKMHVKA